MIFFLLLLNSLLGAIRKAMLGNGPKSLRRFWYETVFCYLWGGRRKKSIEYNSLVMWAYLGGSCNLDTFCQWNMLFRLSSSKRRSDSVYLLKTVYVYFVLSFLPYLTRKCKNFKVLFSFFSYYLKVEILLLLYFFKKKKTLLLPQIHWCPSKINNWWKKRLGGKAKDIFDCSCWGALLWVVPLSFFFVCLFCQIFHTLDLTLTQIIPTIL